MPTDIPGSQNGPAQQLHDDSKGWTFRGRSFSSSEFNTAMVHFYRGELTRSISWRTRLDATTNWAVLTTGTAISFAFSDTKHHHGVLLLNTLLLVIFLFIEARRYRYYELWSHRVRLMETDFFAAMLVPPFAPSKDWADDVASSLLHPHLPITFLEAFGRRYRRNYCWIFLLLAACWIFKNIAMGDIEVHTWADFVQNARIGPVSGDIVLLIGVVFQGVLVAIGTFTAGLQEATSEVLPRPGALSNLGLVLRQVQNNTERLREILPQPLNHHAQSSHPHSHPLVVYIITSRGKDIAREAAEQLRTTMTSLHGTGMYTGQEREVLLCACQSHQLDRLKQIAREHDPESFVIVNSAQEVIGRSFDASA